MRYQRNPTKWPKVELSRIIPSGRKTSIVKTTDAIYLEIRDINRGGDYGGQEKETQTKKVLPTATKKTLRERRPKKTAALPKDPANFPIVGIGASAGGLEALQIFLENMPAAPGIAFVVIQHLSPTHKSIMASLLRKYTQMTVLEIEDGVKIEPGCVYLNPPDKNVAIINRQLYLSEPPQSAWHQFAD